jgi:NAD(P)-dependent dehydrogenase (short-subunit alcohol dehydrogenase family)
MMQTVLVTGGGRGIGRALSLAFGRQGARVAIFARSAKEIHAVAALLESEGKRALPVVCDVTQPEAVAGAVARVVSSFGTISVLVNNAGGAETQKFLGHDDQLWRRMLDQNLSSVYYVTKAVAPAMAEAGYGRIINIASVAGKVGGRYVAAYSAAKHGVLGLTRSLALELAPYNITVNAICPGFVDTSLTQRSIGNIAARTGRSNEEVKRLLESANPQNRLIDPEEVAAVALMLAAHEARGITGQAINVDGGAVFC